MRRRSVTICLVVVFLTWNVMTYMFLASRPQTKQSIPEEFEQRLGKLSAGMRQQADIHQTILDDLQKLENNTLLELLKRQQAKKIEDLGSKDRDEVKQWFRDRFGDDEQQGKPGQVKDAGFDSQGVRHLLPTTRPPKHTAGNHTDVIPVLVIACNRPTVNRNLDQLLRYRPSAERFPIYVSQDCGHKQTADVIRGYGTKLTHLQHPDLSEFKLPSQQRRFQGYYKIARHYKWAFQQIFHKFNHSAVLIVEDDLDISPDFFEYFSATFRILQTDPTLWCVSAWNDNGKSDMVADEPELLYRTDFFPGLGWMIEKKIWLELEDKWPQTFWDDWMRHPDQRKERACIRPEISRTSTFGKIGVSKGLFYEKHLKFIKLNKAIVPFTRKDLSYLKKENYDEMYVKMVYSSPLLDLTEVLKKMHPEHQTVRVQYSTKDEFKRISKSLGIMDDLKSGVPRAGYRGIVSFLYQGKRVYLAPPADWSGYDPKWN